MKRSSVLGVAAAAGMGGVALGQPVFFDDFNGSTLDPRWHIYVPFDYNVSSGSLNVTRLLGSAGPRFRSGGMEVNFPAVEDYRVTVLMSWASEVPGAIEIGMLSGAGVLSTVYISFGVGTENHVRFSPGTGWPLAERPAMNRIHEFTTTRSGDRFRYYINGVLLDEAADPNRVDMLQGLDLSFGEPNDSRRPVSIHSVTVVPSPSGLALLTLLLCPGVLGVSRQR